MRRYEAGTRLDRLPPALRFVWKGAAFVQEEGGGFKPQPGSVLGLQYVAEWSTGQAGRKPRRATALEPMELLELPLESFPRAFTGLGTDILKRLLAAAAAVPLACDAVRALDYEPRFTNAHRHDLRRLVEGAARVDVESLERVTIGDRGYRVLMREGALPTAFFILLGGSSELRRGVQRLAVFRPPAIIASKKLLLKKPLAGSVVVPEEEVGSTVLLRIEGAHLMHLIQTVPDLHRAIRRGSPELIPDPGPPALNQFLMLDSAPSVTLPLRELACLLAERIAAHLEEHVHVVHLVAEATTSRPGKIRRPKGARDGWVAESTIEWPAQAGRVLTYNNELAWMQDGARVAGEVNVTIIDVSALDRPERAQVLELLSTEGARRGPARLLYLLNDVSERPSLDGYGGKVQLIPTGLLSSEVPARLERIRQDGVEHATGDDVKHGRWKLFSRLGEVAGLAADGLRARIRRKRDEATMRWPMGTVRVRFPKDWSSGGPLPRTLEDAPEVLRRTFDRWARAATGRRVGVALGGGGAYGFVHLALLEELLGAPPREASGSSPPEAARAAALSRSVPVDMVSGSSFGSVVGAFYCAGELMGLNLLVDHASMINVVALLGVASSAGLGWWVDYELGAIDLNELEVPLFPVVTDADAGVEWDIRHGTVGLGARASGSLPPLIGPTLVGDRRFLDGGVVANVPVDVLRAEGADIFIAANAISRVSPRVRSFPSVPVLGVLLRELNPILRAKDTLRMLIMVARTAGESQGVGRNTVMYRPKHNHAWVLAFGEGRRIANEARESIQLAQAVAQARAQWRARLNNVPEPVRDDGTRLTLEMPLVVTGRELVAGEQALHELVQYLLERRDIVSFGLEVASSSEKHAGECAEVIRDWLEPLVPQRITGSSVAISSWVAPYALLSLVNVETRKDVDQATVFRFTELVEARREREEEKRRERQVPWIRVLASESERESREGDLELARLLALEAAHAVRTAQAGVLSLDVDRALRCVLARRGLTVGTIESSRSGVTCLAWHPRGTHLAIGDNEGNLRLWNREKKSLEPGARSHSEGTDRSLNHLAWSPAGDLLASSGNDGWVKLWELSSGGDVSAAALRQSPGRGLYVKTWNHWGLAFAPSATWLLAPNVSASGESSKDHRSAALVDLGQSASERNAKPLEVQVDTAAWEPGGDRFATVGSGELVLWRLESGKPVVVERTPFAGACALAWRPQGAARREPMLAVGGAAGILLYSPGRAPVPLETRGAPTSEVAWSPDGGTLAALSQASCAVSLWDGDAGGLMDVLRCDGGVPTHLAWNPAEPGLLAVGEGARVWLWDTLTGRLLTRLTGHTGKLSSMVWSPDGELLATGNRDGTVRLWDHQLGGPDHFSSLTELEAATRSERPIAWSTGQVMPQLELPPRRPATGPWCRLSPDRSRAAVAMLPDSGEGFAVPRVWRTAEGWPSGFLEGLAGRPVDVFWSPDGRWFAVREGKHVSVWEAEPLRLRARASFEQKVLPVAWHPERPLIALGVWAGHGESLRLWDLSTALGGEPSSGEGPWPAPPTPRGSQELDGLWHLAWHPSGAHLAAACNDRHVRVYHVTDRGTPEAPVVTLSTQLQLDNVVQRVAFSPAGNLLATSDRTGVVGIWNAARKDLVMSPQIRGLRGHQLIWNHDGTLLFSADKTGRGLLWRAAEGGWAISAVFDQDLSKPRAAAFSEDGDWLIVVGHDGWLRLHATSLKSLVGRVEARRGRSTFTQAERARFLGGGAQHWSPPAAR
ncbi:patatin-like phospholipase family protein [Hyalangium gracile]|uniref:patatin-like phospholipase family protein n=1 Tax=Hyalangium gracile TaxID=394092 RepID=UPI001CCE7CA9|nr:patatin-like phospholipase family protein [Hyalangium gracile]